MDRETFAGDCTIIREDGEEFNMKDMNVNSLILVFLYYHHAVRDWPKQNNCCEILRKDV